MKISQKKVNGSTISKPAKRIQPAQAAGSAAADPSYDDAMYSIFKNMTSVLSEYGGDIDDGSQLP